jgi:hypothetical protein
MAGTTKNIAKRRKIRALEAARDKVTEQKKSLEERAKVLRVQLKHERLQK